MIAASVRLLVYIIYIILSDCIADYFYNAITNHKYTLITMAPPSRYRSRSPHTNYGNAHKRRRYRRRSRSRERYSRRRSRSRSRSESRSSSRRRRRDEEPRRNRPTYRSSGPNLDSFGDPVLPASCGVVDENLAPVEDDPRRKEALDLKGLTLKGGGRNTESFDPRSTLVRYVRV